MIEIDITKPVAICRGDIWVRPDVIVQDNTARPLERFACDEWLKKINYVRASKLYGRDREIWIPGNTGDGA